MGKPKVSIIVAVSENRVMGKGERIPWHIREDLIRFKEKTKGHVVIMGRKTFDSLIKYYEKSKRPLPTRTHIIVTRDKNYQVTVPNCFVASSIEKALELAKEKEQTEIFISGGAEIFRQTIGMADKLYLTVVKGNFEGDKFFPDYSDFKKVVFKKEKESEGYKYTFLELEK